MWQVAVVHSCCYCIIFSCLKRAQFAYTLTFWNSLWVVSSAPNYKHCCNGHSGTRLLGHMFLSSTQLSELNGSRHMWIFNSLHNNAKLCTNLHSYQNYEQDSTSSSTLGIIRFLHFCQSKGYKVTVVILVCISMIIKETEHLFVSLLTICVSPSV